MWESIILALIGSGVLSVLINRLFNYVDEKHNKDDSLMLLLYHNIKMECKEYIADGEIEADDLEILMKMHETYHSRGGNGYLDKLMAEVNKLPLKQ